MFNVLVLRGNIEVDAVDDSISYAADSFYSCMTYTSLEGRIALKPLREWSGIPGIHVISLQHGWTLKRLSCIQSRPGSSWPSLTGGVAMIESRSEIDSALNR